MKQRRKAYLRSLGHKAQDLEPGLINHHMTQATARALLPHEGYRRDKHGDLEDTLFNIYRADLVPATASAEQPKTAITDTMRALVSGLRAPEREQ
jgi:hypothetical protein